MVDLILFGYCLVCSHAHTHTRTPECRTFSPRWGSILRPPRWESPSLTTRPSSALRTKDEGAARTNTLTDLSSYTDAQQGTIS